MTTYQHARFLVACLDGILMQDCPYSYEILLGEDGSTDGTREIAQRYAAAHPERIHLFLHERSSAIQIDGRPTGRYNLLNNLRHARGTYLCHIDGDDRWTDPQRLRIMVEKMEQEPDLGMAFHNAMNVWDDGRREPYLDPAKGKPRFTLAELTALNFVPTSGAIWRWNGLRDLPPAFREAPFGDWTINLHCARTGPIGYVDRLMSERHVHDASSMSVMSEVRTCRALALAYEVMQRQLGDGLPIEARARWQRQIMGGFDKAYHAGDGANARWFLRHARRVPNGAIGWRTRLRWWGLLNFPRLMEWYASVRVSG